MAKNKESTALTATETTPDLRERFPIMAMEAAGLKELVASNLGTSTLRAFDLPQLKIPGAGGTTWEVPTIEGTQNKAEIEGIILYWRDTRVRFKYPFGQAPVGEKQRPLCKSEDNIQGIGDPGVLCARCPHSQWVNAPAGGKDTPPACNSKRLLFFLPEGEMVPMTIFLPQQSIEPCKKYFLGLMSKGLQPQDIVTAFSLSKERNPNNIAYAVARPKVAAKLTPEQKAPVRAYREAMMPVFAAFSVEQDGGAGGDGDDHVETYQ